MELATDPYTLVYDKIVAALLASVPIQQLIPRLPGNVVSLNKGHGRDQLRHEVKDSDLPELIVRHNTVGGNLNIATNTAEIVRDFEIGLITTPDKLSNEFFQIEWAIVCALIDFNLFSDIRTLEWGGKKFVQSVTFGGADSGENDPETGRGIEGWAALFRLSVRMMFQHDMMRLFNTTGTPVEE